MSGLFALLRFEWTKLRGRRITWVPFAVLAAIVLVIIAVFHRLEFQHMLHLFRSSFQLGSKQDFVNGYYMTAHAMNPLFTVLIPIFIAVASGLSVAGEAEQGTLRACLVRPVTRRALLLSKFLLVTSYALALCFFTLVLLVAGGLANFGHGPLYTLNILFQNGQEGASMVPAAEVPERMLLAGLIATFGMTILAALALLISALVETSAMAYVLTLSLYYAVLTLRTLPLIDWLYPYLFVTHMMAWQQCFCSHLPVGRILVSLIHLVCYLIVFLAAAVLLFEERDIKS